MQKQSWEFPSTPPRLPCDESVSHHDPELLCSPQGDVGAGPVDSDADPLWISAEFTCTRVHACACLRVYMCTTRTRSCGVRTPRGTSCRSHVTQFADAHRYVTSTAPHDTPLGHPVRLLAATGLSVSRVLSFRECYMRESYGIWPLAAAFLPQPEALEMHPGGGCERLVPFGCRAVYRRPAVPELRCPFTSSGAFGISAAGGAYKESCRAQVVLWTRCGLKSPVCASGSPGRSVPLLGAIDPQRGRRAPGLRWGSGRLERTAAG